MDHCLTRLPTCDDSSFCSDGSGNIFNVVGLADPLVVICDTDFCLHIAKPACLSVMPVLAILIALVNLYSSGLEICLLLANKVNIAYRLPIAYSDCWRMLLRFSFQPCYCTYQLKRAAVAIRLKWNEILTIAYRLPSQIAYLQLPLPTRTILRMSTLCLPWSVSFCLTY